MSEDGQRPATFEEAFIDVEPRPGLVATLMARLPELQVKAEQLFYGELDTQQACCLYTTI